MDHLLAGLGMDVRGRDEARKRRRMTDRVIIRCTIEIAPINLMQLTAL